MSRGNEPTHYPNSRDPQTGQHTGTTHRPEAPKLTPVNTVKNADGQGSTQQQEADDDDES